MSQTPTLFIGVGGIGCRIIEHICEKLDDSHKEYVGLIGIDTDAYELEELRGRIPSIKTIRLGDNRRIRDYLDAYPDVDSWFPRDQYLMNRVSINGAGQIRAVSRLLFVDALRTGKLLPITDEYNRIHLFGKPAVVIIGSLFGGTSSGIVVELPYYIRKYVEQISNDSNVYIRGMFIGPDLVDPLFEDTHQKRRAYANAYACLKEINALNIHHINHENMPDELSHNLVVYNYDPDNMSAGNTPYDLINLFESRNEHGTIGNVSFEEICCQIANIINYCFLSSISDLLYKIEDAELVSRSIKCECLNRFVGTGICKIVFPKEHAQEYVSRALINETLDRELLVLDRRYTEIFEALKSREDKTTPIPTLQEFYRSEFEKETIGNEKCGLYSKYIDEAFVRKNGDYISRAKLIILEIKQRLDDLLRSNDIVDQFEACRVNDNEMKTFDQAYIEVERVWTAMSQLSETAVELEKELSIEISKEVLPVDLSQLSLNKNNGNCIFSILENIHPVVARFLIYDLIDGFETLFDDTRNYREHDLYSYKRFDFDVMADGIQTPFEALDIKEGRYKPIMKWLGHGEDKDIETVTKHLNSVSYFHVHSVKEYVFNSVLNNISKILIDELLVLSNIYGDFFACLENTVVKNEALIEDLINRKPPFYELEVYSSECAYRKMFYDYKQLNDYKIDLHDLFSKSLCKDLFSVFADRYLDIKLHQNDFKEQIDYSKMINSIVDNDLLSTTRQYVVNTGDSIFELSVLQAIEKEYEITENRHSLDSYINDKLRIASEKASPFLSVSKYNPEKMKFGFMLVSSDYMESEKKAYESFAYDILWHRRYSVLYDAAVPKEELVFLDINYSLFIEDLEQYCQESYCAQAFSELISDCKNPLEWEITPHLNRHWSEEGFLPSIYPENRKTEIIKVFKAFILGLGFDCFIKVPFRNQIDANGKHVMKWAASVGSSFPDLMRKQDEYIGDGFIDLYNALWFNGEIKKSVLAYSKELMAKIKVISTVDDIESDIMKNDFIMDLIQPDNKNSIIGEENIYDIFLSMYSEMKGPEWDMLMYTLRDILWEFFATMFEGNEQQIDSKTKETLAAIYEYSSMMAATEFNESQIRLKKLHKMFLSMNYK